MTVYLSNHHADAKWAHRIGARLQEEGLSVWDPGLEVRAGDNWARKLGDGLEQSDGMVVLISPHASQSEWLAHEVGFALGSQRFEGRVVPVVVSKSTGRGLPWSLEMFQSIDLTRNAEAGLDDLVRALTGPSEPRRRAKLKNG